MIDLFRYLSDLIKLFYNLLSQYLIIDSLLLDFDLTS